MLIRNICRVPAIWNEPLCFSNHLWQATGVAKGKALSDSMVFVMFCFLPVWFEPTCLDKAGKVVDTGMIDKLTFISPNMAEFLEINRLLTASKSTGPSRPRKPTFDANFSGGCVCATISPPVSASDGLQGLV